MGVDVVDLLRGEARWEERWGWGGGGGGNERGVSFIREMKRRKKRPEFRREKNGKKIDSPALTACSMHAFHPAPVRPRLRHVVRVAPQGPAGELADDVCSAPLGVLERLQHEDAGALLKSFFKKKRGRKRVSVGKDS